MEKKIHKKGEIRELPCWGCPFMAGIKGDRILCLNPQVTGMEGVPVPIAPDHKPKCLYDKN